MNNKSRTENVIKNMKFAVVCQVLSTLFSFICRTIFIKKLGAEYLGLNGLFTNILTILSFAELGIGDAIIFSMYKPVAEDNKEKIKFEIENLNAEYKVLISQKIKDLTNTTNEYQREMIENTYKELEKDKTNRIEQLQKLLEQQQKDLDTEKIKRLKTAIEYFDDILKSNEPNRYILECLIDKIWIYHDKSVKFELKPEISRLI